MTPEQQKIVEFHQVFDLPIETIPTVPKRNICNLRMNLIIEELEELGDALEARDIIGVADAIGDLLYVVYGAAVSCGLDMEPIFNEIHRSNMTKVGGHKREDGKWIKPTTYEPPNISSIISAQRIRHDSRFCTTCGLPICQTCGHYLYRWGWYEDPDEPIEYWICGSPMCQWSVDSIRVFPKRRLSCV